jgi:hypothetical protein
MFALLSVLETLDPKTEPKKTGTKFVLSAAKKNPSKNFSYQEAISEEINVRPVILVD